MDTRPRVLPPIRYKDPKKQNFLTLILCCLLLILLVLLLRGGQRNLRIPFFPDTGAENIAFKRPVTASSSINTTNSAATAVDGDQNTVWHSIRALPASITVTLDRSYSVNQVILKMPAGQGAKSQTIEVLGSMDNSLFTQLAAPKSYYFNPTVTINFNSAAARFVRLVISANSQTVQAQIAEFEVYGVIPPAQWEIQSVDVMKYSKDVVCNPPSDAFINTQVSLAKDLGANFIAISTPYDDLPCGSALTLTTRWVQAIRAQGLHVWHRHMKSSFEGISGVPKKYNDDPLQTMSDYIISNPTLFDAGDIFTPTPEPDNAGISGVTSCYGVCQFKDASDFNQWIRNAQLIAKLSFAKIGLPDMKIGYYGTSGFIVFGENNPDWIGKSLLEQKTVDSMNGVIAIDSYPEFYNGSMAYNLDIAHTVWPNATLVIGEWGTTSIATDSAKIQAVVNSMGAAKRSYVKGFNYWNLGPAGNEGLINASQSALPAYQTVKDFYSGFR